MSVSGNSVGKKHEQEKRGVNLIGIVKQVCEA